MLNFADMENVSEGKGGVYFWLGLYLMPWKLMFESH